MRLVRPELGHELSYREFVAELLAAGDDRSAMGPVRNLEDFPNFVGQQAEDPRSKPLPEGMVPMSIFFFVDEDEAVQGELRFRYALGAGNSLEGGHIGYVVRPSCRRRGYGREILRGALELAAREAIDPVLITCDDDNVASIGVIEANGGGDYETAISPRTGKLIRRYWISSKSAD